MPRISLKGAKAQRLLVAAGLALAAAAYPLATAFAQEPNTPPGDTVVVLPDSPDALVLSVGWAPAPDFTPEVDPDCGAGIDSSPYVTLEWSAPEDNGQPIADYHVYRRQTAPEADAEEAAARVDSGDEASTDTSYTDTGVSSCATYEYYVLAHNGSAASPDKNTASIEVTDPAPTKPAAPKNLSSAPGSGLSLVFTWDDPGDENIIGYSVGFKKSSSDTCCDYLEVPAEDVEAFTTILGEAKLSWTHTRDLHDDSSLEHGEEYLHIFQPRYHTLQGDHAQTLGDTAQLTSTAVVASDSPDDLVLSVGWAPAPDFTPEVDPDCGAGIDSSPYVTLEWSAPEDNGQPIADYHVYRRQTAPEADAEEAAARVDSGDEASTDTSYTDTGVSSCATYEYYVLAHNGSAASPDKNTASIEVTDPAPTKPAAPKNLSSAPGSGLSLVFTWDDPGDENIIGYSVGFKKSSSDTCCDYLEVPAEDVEAFTTILGEAKLSWTHTRDLHDDSSLEHGEEYLHIFQPRYHTLQGDHAQTLGDTAQLTSTAPPVPDSPDDLELDYGWSPDLHLGPEDDPDCGAGIDSEPYVTLEWSAPEDNGQPIADYHIYRRQTAPEADAEETATRLDSGDKASTSTSYTDTGVSSCATYEYYVLAHNGSAASADKNTASIEVTDPGPIDPPQNLSIALSWQGTRPIITLTWDEPDHNGSHLLDYFVIRKRTSPGYKTTKTDNFSETELVDNSTQLGGTYKYIVYALAPAGSTASTVTITIPTSAPDSTTPIGGL